MLSDFDSAFELTEAQHDRVAGLLDRIRSEFRASTALLLESCGRPLGRSGELEDTDLPALASLSASALSAATHLAALLGEPGATVALHREGREFLHLAGHGRLVLALSFSADPPQGLERLRARLRLKRAFAELEAILEEPNREGGPGPFSAQEIGEALAPLARETAEG